MRWPVPWTPNSAGSQFYHFCLGPQHNLDSGYTESSAPRSEGSDVIGRLRAGDEIRHIEIVHEAFKDSPRERGKRRPLRASKGYM